MFVSAQVHKVQNTDDFHTLKNARGDKTLLTARTKKTVFFFLIQFPPFDFPLFPFPPPPPPFTPPTHSLLTHLYPNHGTHTTTVLGSRRGRRTVETGGARKKGDSIPENRGVGRC